MASHGTVTIARSPGKPYGIHISACVHARNTGASSAGQISGSSIPHGHRAESAVTSHRIATAAVPYTIGQPTRAAVLAGSANMRAGKIDVRAPRLPASPKLNAARRYE